MAARSHSRRGAATASRFRLWAMGFFMALLYTRSRPTHERHSESPRGGGASPPPPRKRPPPVGPRLRELHRLDIRVDPETQRYWRQRHEVAAVGDPVLEDGEPDVINLARRQGLVIELTGVELPSQLHGPFAVLPQPVGEDIGNALGRRLEHGVRQDIALLEGGRRVEGN